MLSTKGYRVLCVDAYGEYPAERYIAVWIADGVPAGDWVARQRMTGSEFQKEFDAWNKAGFRMIWICAIGRDSETRFAGVWIRNRAGWSSLVNVNRSVSEYQTLVEDYCRAGYRPKCLTAYGSNSDPRFGAIFVRPDGPHFEIQPRWLAKHGLTAAAQQQLCDDSASTTFRPECVIEYGSSTEPRYDSVWLEDCGAAHFTATGTPVPEWNVLDDVVEEFMTTRKISHGALAVTKNGRLVLSRAYTYAPAGEPLTQTDNMFRIASVSKPITAIGILQLVEHGLLDLEDTIGDFPELNRSAWCDPRVAQGFSARLAGALRGLG